MANPKNKQELLASMTDGYAKLCEQIAKMSDEEKAKPFNFAADPKKCGVRWQYDCCLRDLLIHLHEWQVLMREFVQNIREGHPRDYLQDEMLSLADSFSEEELFTKGYYKNTYTTTMAAYFVSVTTSPYGQAVKLLKTHQKNCRN